MKVHFIAIGGSAMHNLAIALHKKGYELSGSDDQIFEPSKSRLLKYNLLPKQEGWFPENISSDLDAIILGMHARKDNPELLRAQELGLKIYSYPEYIYEQSKHKKRVVIGGSHGKTSITSMVLHVLKKMNRSFDYLVGAQLEGYETMVSLEDKNDLIILEGDEYLSSPIDLRPKFHWYKADTAVLTGIAWDHINVFPSFENYVEQFKLFMDSMNKPGRLFYYAGDAELQKLAAQAPQQLTCIGYDTPEYTMSNGICEVEGHSLQIFGEHNLQNLEAAYLLVEDLGVKRESFLKAMEDFKGASKRLEKIRIEENFNVFKDFAHSPSKLKATCKAVKDLNPERKLVACMELHTFSSLNKQFLPEYNKAMNAADEAIVYFNPETLKHKKLESISPEDVKNAFGRDDLKVYTESNELISYLKSKRWSETNLLLMSSGNFDGQRFEDLADALVL